MLAVAVRWQCPLHAGDDTNFLHVMGTSTGGGRFNRRPTPLVHIAGGAAARVATEILRGVGLAEIGPVLRRDSLQIADLHWLGRSIRDGAAAPQHPQPVGLWTRGRSPTGEAADSIRCATPTGSPMVV
jgi:hypothetical protein